MTRRAMPSDLPPDAARYLAQMRSLDRPPDLVDRVMAEVEATRQERAAFFSTIPNWLLVAGAVAAAILVAALLLRFAPPNVGPETSPTPAPSGQLPSAGTIVNRFAVDPSYRMLFYAHDFLWMQRDESGRLIRVDPTTGAVDTLLVTAGAEGVRVAADETSIWALDNRDHDLVEIDPRALLEVRRVHIGGLSSRAFAVGGGAAWTGNDEGVARFDLGTGIEDFRTPNLVPHVIVLDSNNVWVGEDDGQLTRLNANTGEIEAQVATQVVAFGMAQAGDIIVVYGGVVGTVSVSTATHEIVARTPNFGSPVQEEGTTLGTPAAGGGRVWATMGSAIVEVDPTTLRPIAALQLDGSDHGYAYGGGALWISGTDATGAGVLLQIEPSQIAP